MPDQPAPLRRSFDAAGGNNAAEPAAKRLKSPSNSIKNEAEAEADDDDDVDDDDRVRNTPAVADESTAELSRPATKSKRHLWTEGDPPLTRNAGGIATGAATQATPKPRARRQQGSRSAAAGQQSEEEDPSVEVMITQPETRPISQEQLVAEVKGIYAGLVLVESKCIEVDAAQSVPSEGGIKKLNNEQWQALIALHRTLLHEHHDFFLASQHPSASPALRKLAQKYAMPARMWRHGIHSFLELLRHRLPASLEHMLTFIYLAYSMMALLYETVPAFEDTWIECLGDLGRYRMAIEDEDIRDREIWTGVSRHWYSKASDKAPTTGRLHHHLAILARPNAVQQLFYYTKSLCVASPFHSARESILTLFDPIMNGAPNRLQPIDVAFVKLHGIQFIVSNTNTNDEHKSLPRPLEDLMHEHRQAKAKFMGALDSHIARSTKAWTEPGAFIAIANTNSLLEYGKIEPNSAGPGNVIMSMIAPKPAVKVDNATQKADVKMEGTDEEKPPCPSLIFPVASDLSKDCDELVFRRYGDNNVLGYMNVRLTFLNFLAGKDAVMQHVERQVPWTLLANMLTTLSIGFNKPQRYETKDFPVASERCLCEDWNLRGLLWTGDLFPASWFRSDQVDDDEKSFEVPSMTADRRERVLWLGWNLAAHNKWLVYNNETHQFRAAPEFHQPHHEFGAEGATFAEGDDAVSRMSTADSTATMVDGAAKEWKGGGASDAGDSMVVEPAEAQ